MAQIRFASVHGRFSDGGSMGSARVWRAMLGVPPNISYPGSAVESIKRGGARQSAAFRFIYGELMR
jgi:hypothetical protein